MLPVRFFDPQFAVHTYSNSLFAQVLRPRSAVSFSDGKFRAAAPTRSLFLSLLEQGRMYLAGIDADFDGNDNDDAVTSQGTHFRLNRKRKRSI